MTLQFFLALGEQRSPEHRAFSERPMPQQRIKARSYIYQRGQGVLVINHVSLQLFGKVNDKRNTHDLRVDHTRVPKMPQFFVSVSLMDFKSAFVIEARAHRPIGTGSFWTIVEAKLMNIHRLRIEEEGTIIRL